MGSPQRAITCSQAIRFRSLLSSEAPFWGVSSGVQIVAYWLIGNPIDYRPVPLDEHILCSIVPMVVGMLFLFVYAGRRRAR